jgi:hypothetical protein
MANATLTCRVVSSRPVGGFIIELVYLVSIVFALPPNGHIALPRPRAPRLRGRQGRPPQADLPERVSATPALLCRRAT